MLRRARADHQDRARAIAGADRDMRGPRRAVQVIPLAHAALLALDDGQALPGEHEEALLLALAVVAAGGLARVEDVDADPQHRGR